MNNFDIEKSEESEQNKENDEKNSKSDFFNFSTFSFFSHRPQCRRSMSSALDEKIEFRYFSYVFNFFPCRHHTAIHSQATCIENKIFIME